MNTISDINRVELEDGLTFIDFLPECHSPRSIFSTPKYATFSSLIDKVNDWLKANPLWEMKTCESVEFKEDRSNEINTEDTMYRECAMASNWYIRGLRIWITKSEKENVQQIGYLNIIPQLTKEGGLLSQPEFESLDEMTDKFNEKSQFQPIPGHIITIETQKIKIEKSTEIDPEQTAWTINSTLTNRFLFIIRVIYEISSENFEKIGFKDFVPSVLESKGKAFLSTFENFSNVVDRASYWLSQQSDIKFCNVQSFNTKIGRQDNDVDPQQTSFAEYSNMPRTYIRIVRVAYLKMPINRKADFNSVKNFKCKVFLPVQLVKSSFKPKFETLLETKRRISAWMKATGAHVVSAETTVLKFNRRSKSKQNSEVTFTHLNDPRQNEFLISAIRIYLNGSYNEPAEGLLPLVPEMKNEKCSIL